MTTAMNAERRRLLEQRDGRADWRLWGPYLAERAWGTVREDYSPDGSAWRYFPFEQAHSRAYRWNEDGLGGICDEQQRLCLALALWNGKDPILKERAFGLTGEQGNRGEDVKERYFYRDATPSHSWLRYQYQYPQAAFPYRELVDQNRRRDRTEPPFSLLDSGVFDQRRYWDVELLYAKAGPREVRIRIIAHNRGPNDATLHLLPTLWFRNTWSWEQSEPRPNIVVADDCGDAAWAVQASHSTLGSYWLYGRQSAELLFTENESNTRSLWAYQGPDRYVKDAFHRYVVNAETGAVNPSQRGSKFAAWQRLRVPAGQHWQVEMLLTAAPAARPFAGSAALFSRRQSEATVFYDDLLPEADAHDGRILRQALAGMIWTKQFYHYDVERWLDGDPDSGAPLPPVERRAGRNTHWRHLKAHDVISMPDAWEYPWFAAWDLAYQCAALALVDVDFAKDQVALLLSDRYLHPNGQIPAYEWYFGDVNPPLHAMAALKVFRAERVQRGVGDLDFLQRVFHKLLLVFAWWINRKDADGHNLFEGGFMGLDNISVYNRSEPLPAGYTLKQADATGWMAHFSLKMTVIALELCARSDGYEDMAIHCYKQFLAIARAIAGGDESGTPPLWDIENGFFTDLVVTPDGQTHRIEVYSMVGLIPLFATEVVDQRLLQMAPRFAKLLREQKGGLFQGDYVCACPAWENERGEHLLSLVDHSMLPRILARVLDEEQFLSRYGVRSLSRIHATDRDLGHIPGIGEALIDYVPGESDSPLFGGNSNWRGPVWLPVNYSLVHAIERFYRFLGDEFTVAVPCLDGRRLNLKEVATLIAERIADLYRHQAGGRVPALETANPQGHDPAWQDLLLFCEYFHADSGEGLGATHQTGWTGLLANLVMRRYHREISAWSGLDPSRGDAPVDELL